MADVNQKYATPDKQEVAIGVEVKLEIPPKGKKYANPHILQVAKSGKPIVFKAVKTDFEIFIHNKDRFFDSEDDTLEYNIKAGEVEKTPPVNSNLNSGDKKYYILYSVKNKDYSDGPDTSPPKIVVT